MDWKDIAKGYDAPPEDLQQPLNIQRCTMKVVFGMNLAALCVSVRCSRGDSYRWQWKWGENALLCGSSCLLTPNNMGKHKLRMKWLKTGAQPPSETPQASPPRLVLTLLIAAGFWGKKEAENVSVFICFKSRPVLLQIHKKQHFFPSFFFYLLLHFSIDPKLARMVIFYATLSGPIWTFQAAASSNSEGIMSLSQAVAKKQVEMKKRRKHCWKGWSRVHFFLSNFFFFF